ncbi:hypothetical protein [Streptomyces sp. NPDC058441]|uniref:hypothetical protein n=1 Tax=Streptomyces sp. NPDC058441 TaxID=3346502 RepID=UPI00364EDF3A
MAGAEALGLRSVWVTDGRPWSQNSYQPTHVATDVASAIGPLCGNRDKTPPPVEPRGRSE